MRRLAWIALAAAAFSGCGGGASADDGGGGAGAGASGAAAECSQDATSGDLPCDVAEVVKARCQPCHAIPLMNNAKFPLLTYEDFAAPFGTTGKTRWRRVAEVIEPGGLPHMPKDWKTNGELTKAQLEVLRTWLHACAPPEPEGDGCEIGE